MPAPTQPPYEAGALLQPRQLQRWLDVNKVNKLTRTETYWTVPAFSVDSDWLGYSKIVAVFDFTATNNFSLLPDFDIPSSDFLACIMWVDEDHNVYRYKLWSDVGEVLFFSIPLYAGQLIKKNFRIEIWDVAPANTLSFTLAGAGTAGANGSYTYQGSNIYLNADTAYEVHYDGSVEWEVTDNFSNVKYVISGNFPYSPWTISGSGVDPAPHGFISKSSAMADVANFYTSVSGHYDYMWQDDNTIAVASAIVTNFSVPVNGGSTFTLPIVWPADSVPTMN